MYPLYTAAFAALLAVYAPAAVARRLIHGVPINLRERLGHGGSPSPAPAGWIHAVSVGEALAAASLVEAIHRLWPTLPLVVTTVTATGARVVQERYAGVASHRFFPLDLPGAVHRAIAAIDPAFFLCIETELWPNTLRALAARGVPTMVANGRLSDRSFRRYRLVGRFMRRVLDDVRIFAMQSDEDARRILALGARPERVVVTGNLKHEPVADPPGAPELWQRLLGLGRDHRMWIAGSTHRGEEEQILDAHGRALAACPGLALILAPRHPERVGEVADLVAARGWTPVRRSALPAAGGPFNGRTVIVLDTVGELAQLYTIADVVFVGGSLVPAGGHNMLEPAFRKKPVLFGPHTENFREPAGLLRDHGAAILVRDAGELDSALTRLLGDHALRERLGAAGYEAVVSRHGAVRETLGLLTRLVTPETGA